MSISSRQTDNYCPNPNALVTTSKHMYGMRFLLFITFFSLIHTGFSQKIESLVQAEEYEKAIALAVESDSLTGEDHFWTGRAYFMLSEDEKAILNYNQAISGGFEEYEVYFFRGVAQRLDKQFEAAESSLRTAMKKNALAQYPYTELGNLFLNQERYDSALYYFDLAREMEYQSGDSYLKLPIIYQMQEDYETALAEYRKSLDLILPVAPEYREILIEIGRLEYGFTQNYPQAIESYAAALKNTPDDYKIQEKLIKAYFANKEYNKGDSVFKMFQKAYLDEALPEDYMEFGSVPIAETTWNGRKIIVYRMLKDPSEMLDIKYKIYLLNEAGDAIDRTLMTEKTIQLQENGAKHLLCERERSGTHHTYGFGWSTDEIDFESLISASRSVFSGEIRPSASSNFSAPAVQKKKKRRRKNKD